MGQVKKAREVILRAVEGGSLAPEGEPRAVSIEVYADETTERAIVYCEGEAARVYYRAESWPLWVRQWARLCGVLDR